MRPTFLQRKHVEFDVWLSFYGKGSIVLELWWVEVDRTDGKEVQQAQFYHVKHLIGSILLTNSELY